MKMKMRSAVLATAGIAVAGGAVFGATEAFAASPAASSSSAATTATTTTSKTPCKDAAHPARCALLKRGAHGQQTVKDKAGAYVVHEWQVGKVGSVGVGSLTVTDGSGTTWTWTVASGTKVRVSGSAASLSGVKVGDTILVSGLRSGSANDAKAVFDPDQSKLG